MKTFLYRLGEFARHALGWPLIVKPVIYGVQPYTNVTVEMRYTMDGYKVQTINALLKNDGDLQYALLAGEALGIPAEQVKRMRAYYKGTFYHEVHPKPKEYNIDRLYDQLPTGRPTVLKAFNYPLLVAIGYYREGVYKQEGDNLVAVDFEITPTTVATVAGGGKNGGKDANGKDQSHDNRTLFADLDASENGGSQDNVPELLGAPELNDSDTTNTGGNNLQQKKDIPDIAEFFNDADADSDVADGDITDPFALGNGPVNNAFLDFSTFNNAIATFTDGMDRTNAAGQNSEDSIAAVGPNVADPMIDTGTIHSIMGRAADLVSRTAGPIAGSAADNPAQPIEVDIVAALGDENTRLVIENMSRLRDLNIKEYYSKLQKKIEQKKERIRKHRRKYNFLSQFVGDSPDNIHWLMSYFYSSSNSSRLGAAGTTTYTYSNVKEYFIAKGVDEEFIDALFKLGGVAHYNDRLLLSQVYQIVASYWGDVYGFIIVEDLVKNVQPAEYQIAVQ